MEKIIYHGSDHIIEKPKFGYGKPYNDYGIGFYCTQNPNMAKEWGVGIDHNGYANRYKIECDGLTILDLNAPGYTLLQPSQSRHRLQRHAADTGMYQKYPVQSSSDKEELPSASPSIFSRPV